MFEQLRNTFAVLKFLNGANCAEAKAKASLEKFKMFLFAEVPYK